VKEINGFREVRARADDLPALTDQHKRALIDIASAGGAVARLALSRAMLTDLLRSNAIAVSVPGTVEISSLGIRVLADLAASTQPAPLDS
jgi:hypothetical protein